jgi:signal transduction histidine kinase/PAS domain-containing protein
MARMGVGSDVEASRLRTLLRDLAALADIPGVWLERAATMSDSGTREVALGLADALVGLLDLDFAFVRLSDPGGAGAQVVARGKAWRRLEHVLERRMPLTRRELVADANDARRGLVLPIGPGGEAGVLAVAGERSGFPSATDQLLLSLAANLLATAFQSARHVRERRKAEDALRAARDDLEREIAQRTDELRRSQAYLAEAQRLTQNGSFAVDVRTREITHSSVEHSRMYGFDRQRDTRSLADFMDRIHPEDRGECIDALERGIREGASIEVEYRVVLPRAAERRHRAIAHPVFGATGSLDEYVGTVVDVTERRASEAELQRLASEQAALRRVATLVAKEVSPAEVFAKVAEEVASVLGVECSLFRTEDDRMATTVALHGAAISARARIGRRFPIDGDGVIATVLRTGEPYRLDDLSAATGAIAEAGRDELGVRSAAGCPILVRGRVWGAIGAASYEPHGFSAETEARMARFAELAATAVANAEARAEVIRLADLQSALRRVATLVAEGGTPSQVFDAVASETAALLDADSVALCRYEPGGELTVVAHRGLRAELLPPGTRVQHDRESVSSIVRRTQRPARMDSYADAHGQIGGLVEDLRFRSGVGAPIVVDGRLWGVTIANWAGEAPPPRATEERMAQFAELIDIAIANANGRDLLTASRARLVTEADDARRGVVRDLHDGAQQRMVHTIINLKLALRALRGHGDDVEPLVADALEQAERGMEELRELAHGILPTVLSRGGLRAGVDEVIQRLGFPVRAEVPPLRLAPEIEASAYFIVAEALTNVVKHAAAKRAEVRASVDAGMLLLEVRDDGVGGADPHGHGLLGLEDRATALGGRLEVESPAGGGTMVVARLPLA